MKSRMSGLLRHAGVAYIHGTGGHRSTLCVGVTGLSQRAGGLVYPGVVHGYLPIEMRGGKGQTAALSPVFGGKAGERCPQAKMDLVKNQVHPDRQANAALSNVEPSEDVKKVLQYPLGLKEQPREVLHWLQNDNDIEDGVSK